jgi:phage shock protein C
MTRDNRTGWSVLIGLALIALGVWLLLGRLFYPFAVIVNFMGRIGWPLVLVGLGVLLILRGRGGGSNVSGKRLYRSRTNRMIGGVIGGFAEFMGVDATVLRVIFAFLTLFTGIWYGLLLYILAMIIVPEEPYPAGWVPPAAPSAPTPPPPPAPPVPGPSGSAPEPPAPPAAPAPIDSAPPEAPPVPPTSQEQ